MAVQPEQPSPVPGIRRPQPEAAPDAGRLPDFLVIGGMKCGSTTLYEHLSRHPDLFLSSPKEPQFFSREPVFARGLHWYRSLFEGAGSRVCGEASTCYSRAPHFGDVAARIHLHLPDARLVYLVRHPVDRAYSHYRHEAQARIVAGGAALPSFEEMLEENDEIVDTSDYWRQLQEYLAHYPREQIHVLSLEDLQSRRDETLAALQQFLGIRIQPLASAVETHSNPFGDKIARNEMHELVSTVRNDGWLRGAIDRVPAGLRAWARRQLTDPRVARRIFSHRIRSRRESLAPMNPQTRQRLLTHFAESNRALESFLGVSLEEWSV